MGNTFSEMGGEISDTTTNLMEGPTDLAVDGVQATSAAFGRVGGKLGDGLQATKDGYSASKDTVEKAGGTISLWLWLQKEDAAKAAHAVGHTGKAASESVAAAGQSVADGAKTGWEATSSTAVSAYETVGSGLKAAGDVTYVNGVGTVVVNGTTTAAGAVGSGATSAYEATKSGVKAAGQTAAISGTIDAAKSAGKYVGDSAVATGNGAADVGVGTGIGVVGALGRTVGLTQ